jgi:MFS family permease
VIGDRHDRRMVMIVSDLLGAACFVAMAFAAAPAALVAIKVLAALVAAPAIPAAGAALPAVAPPGTLPRANATLAAAGTAGALAGPMLGGILLAGSGASLVFILNALSFLVSAFLLAGLRGSPSSGPARVVERGRLRAGFRALWRDRLLRRASAGLAFVCLGLGVTLPAEPVLAAGFVSGSAGYGILIAGWGGGGVLGAASGARVVARRGAPAALVVAAAGIGVGLLGAGIAPLFALALAAFALGGASEGLALVARQMLLQQRVPDRVRSRALAAEDAVGQAALAAGLVCAGPLIDGLGPGGTFALGACFCLGGAMLVAGWTRSVTWKQR